MNSRERIAKVLSREVHHRLDAEANKISQEFAVFDADHGLPETVLLDEHNKQ